MRGSLTSATHTHNHTQTREALDRAHHRPQPLFPPCGTVKATGCLARDVVMLVNVRFCVQFVTILHLVVTGEQNTAKKLPLFEALLL